MLHRTTLEQAIAAKTTVQRSRDILAQNIEPSVDKERELEERADKLAKLVVLYTTMHRSPVQVLSEEQQIQDHMRRMAMVEKRDAQAVFEALRNQLTAELYDGDMMHRTNDALRRVFEDMNVKEVLVLRLCDILDRKDAERYGMLRKLIGELLLTLRNLLYHVKLAKKYLGEDESFLKEEIKLLVNQHRV